MHSHDLGIDIKNKLVIRAPKVQEEGSDISAEAFRNQLSMIPAIKSVASMDEVPGSEVYWKSDNYQRKGSTSSGVISWLTVGDHYFDLLKIPLAQGRLFDKTKDTYQSSVVLNETAVRAFGFDNVQHAIGSILELGEQEIRIVGVVADFHQQGLSKKIDPTVFRFSANTLNYFVVDIPSNDSRTLSQLEDVFVRNFPDSPYEYFFLDEHFNKQYLSEKLLSKIGFSLTIFSLILAAIGLAGLSLQTVSQRSKEIGIRKVMGATVRSLLVLLSKEYFIILVISAMISLPISFIAFESWLSHFAFKVDIGAWLFCIPVLAVFVIMSLSIGWQTLKATLANPVRSLKYE
jgi:putative ABC transport system permease protein